MIVLCSIKLSNLKIPTSDVKSGASGLTVEASGISLSGGANWHYRESSWSVCRGRRHFSHY